MRKRAEKLADSSMKINHMLELTADGRRVYFKLMDIFGAEAEISMAEAVRETKMDPLEFELSVDSLVNKGYMHPTKQFHNASRTLQKTKLEMI